MNNVFVGFGVVVEGEIFCDIRAGTLKVTSPSASALGVRVAVYSASPSVPDVRVIVAGPVISMSST